MGKVLLHDAVLLIRLPRAIKRRTERRAQELGLSVSEMVRLLLLYGEAIDIRGKGKSHGS